MMWISYWLQVWQSQLALFVYEALIARCVGRAASLQIASVSVRAILKHCLAKTRSTFEMNDIREDRVTKLHGRSCALRDEQMPGTRLRI